MIATLVIGAPKPTPSLRGLEVMNSKAALVAVRVWILVTQENICKVVGTRVTGSPLKIVAQALHVAEFGHVDGLGNRVGNCTLFLDREIADIRYHSYLE